MTVEPEMGLENARLSGAGTGQISVVIPAFNAAAFLPAALRSVFAQSSPPGEIIVVDDGSTDDTASVARELGARVVTLPNGGPSAARNAGTRLARGEFVAFMDADDLWQPQKLAVQHAALEAFGKPAFSFTDFRIFDEHGIHTRSSGLNHHPMFRRVVRKAQALTKNEVLIAATGRGPVLSDSYIQPSSALVRRADVLAVGGFDERLRVHEDHEFFLRLFLIRPAIAVLESLMLYRRHAAQATADQTTMRNGFIDIASMVAAAPERYPAGDVRYLAATDFLRHYRLGLEQARHGRFDEAAASFKRSLGRRRTLRAGAALLGAQLCRTDAGRDAFDLVRALAKYRPGRRRIK